MAPATDKALLVEISSPVCFFTSSCAGLDIFVGGEPSIAAGLFYQRDKGGFSLSRYIYDGVGVGFLIWAFISAESGRYRMA